MGRSTISKRSGTARRHTGFPRDFRAYRAAVSATITASIVARIASIAATVAVLIGCGIPDLAYLEPPTLGTVTDFPATVTFLHSTDNNTDSFSGYELYYKIYAPAAGDERFQADRAAIVDASPGAVGATIAGRGYLRIHRLPDDGRAFDGKPVLNVPPADRGTRFTVTVEFQQVAQTGAAASWDAAEARNVLLLRNQSALGNPTPPIGFAEEDFSPTHADLPGLELDERGLMMGLVVVSYGTDFVTGLFGELYSAAIVPERPLRIFAQ